MIDPLTLMILAMPEPLAIVFEAAMQGPPDLVGLSTWYGINDGSTDVTRSGREFELGAPICAVDDGVWYEYAGRRAYVQTGDRLFSCVIGDSGWLDEAGTFDGEYVVLDVPHDYYVAATGGEETKKVRVWIE